MAKGIRRITAVTGQEALNTVKNGVEFAQKVMSLSMRLDKGGDYASINADASALRYYCHIVGSVDFINLSRGEVEVPVMSHIDRNRLRARLETIQKDSFIRMNEQKQARVNAQLDKILEVQCRYWCVLYHYWQFSTGRCCEGEEWSNDTGPKCESGY